MSPARWSVDVDVAHDHPAFDGHFPGAPVRPGAVLLGFALDAVRSTAALDARWREAPWMLDQAKFLAPVPPGATLRVEASALHVDGTVRSVTFEMTHDGRPVARGRWAVAR